jgi:hypothetical protein
MLRLLLHKLYSVHTDIYPASRADFNIDSYCGNHRVAEYLNIYFYAIFTDWVLTAQ